MSYFVNERFHTWQGEGDHMGRRAFFIRLHGCPVKCPWCDSAGTWHPDYVPENVERVSVSSLITEVEASGAKIVVITGGEPTIHDLRSLVERLHHDAGVRVHLETSGGFPIRGNFDWITLSPKKWKHPLRESVEDADEFKFIIETPEDIRFYFDMILAFGAGREKIRHIDRASVWLHPEWSQHKNPEVLKAISTAVKSITHPHVELRAGWQLHKLYQVDAEDARSRPLVPLGGDPAKGY